MNFPSDPKPDLRPPAARDGESRRRGRTVVAGVAAALLSAAVIAASLVALTATAARTAAGYRVGARLI